MKLAWLTDIHLNFLEREDIEAFFRSVAEMPSDAILLSGDVGEAPDVEIYLNDLDRRTSGQSTSFWAIMIFIGEASRASEAK